MTGQIPDTIEFRDADYKLLAFYPERPFSPGKIGINPRSISSGCHRGYACHFKLTDTLFKLNSLELSLAYEDGQPIPVTEMPPVFGVNASKIGDGFACNVGEYVGLDFQLPFSGEILFGRFDDLYRALWNGHTRPWECAEVWHLVCIDGHASKIQNVSAIFERFRELYMVQFCDLRDAADARGKPTSDEYTIYYCLPEYRDNYLKFIRRRFGHRFNI